MPPRPQDHHLQGITEQVRSLLFGNWVTPSQLPFLPLGNKVRTPVCVCVCVCVCEREREREREGKRERESSPALSLHHHCPGHRLLMAAPLLHHGVLTHKLGIQDPGRLSGCLTVAIARSSTSTLLPYWPTQPSISERKCQPPFFQTPLQPKPCHMTQS